MSNHVYPNPGVYLPLMTAGGDYVFSTVNNGETYYFAVPQNANIADDTKRLSCVHSYYR